MKMNLLLLRHLLCVAAMSAVFTDGRKAMATTVNVDVGVGGAVSVGIQAGDTVKWTWKDSGHSVTSGSPYWPFGHGGLFDSGIHSKGFTFSFTFPNAGTFRYYCLADWDIGIVVVSPTPRPPSQEQLLNISTRMDLKTGANVLIGGFIVTGNEAKKVIFRAIGPSLNPGVVGALADPVLELHASDGSLITSNDNWKDTQQTDIEATGIPPQNDLESAIVATLDPGAYTAIVSGKNATSGIGLVEIYDLDQLADAQLANVSTRGFVETGSNVMIGGFILGNGSGTTNLLIRAIGPSMGPSMLEDPVLDLHDSNGDIVMSNDNWEDTLLAEIEATGLPPINTSESAMVVTIPTGAYTAIVMDKNGGTGVGLVEVYRLP